MTSQFISLVIVVVALLGFGAVILYRATHRREVPPTPPASPTPVRAAPVPLAETEHEQLIRALLTIDGNAAARMGDLKTFLFFLPFLWGVIWAILYVIYREVR